MKYKFMSRPCTIASEDKLWCLVGQSEKYGGGILAWCYDEHDAEWCLAQVKDDPDFKSVRIHKYTED